MERVRERGGYLEAGPSKLAAASQAKLGASTYLVDSVAQRNEVITGGAEDRDAEESVLLSAVTARSLQVGVAEAVASTPDDQELVVRRRPFSDDLSWRKSKRHQSRYQAGDRIVTLAPSAHGQLVTSQRGHLVGVDPEAGSLRVRMDDGRTHALGPDQIGPDKLALGYATTVHRSQGATFDTAHLYADGGGRELGYVAMSRARHTAHVHAVADNVYQAVEDLTWDWSRERRQAWAIDTGSPERVGRHPIEIEADKQAPGKLRAVLSRARLKAERAALTAAAPDQPDPAVRRQVTGLDRHIQLR